MKKKKICIYPDLLFIKYKILDDLANNLNRQKLDRTIIQHCIRTQKMDVEDMNT